MELEDKIKRNIREIQDYPKPGVLFKDITPMLANPSLVREVVNELVRCFEAQQVDAIVGVEARGFIFGSALAYRIKKGFVPIRKPGKLPATTVSEEYSLEYGTDKIEMHVDAIKEGDRVLLIDDLLATGGTMAAACSLIEKAGGKVAECSFLIELAFLNGRDKLKGHDVYSMVTY